MTDPINRINAILKRATPQLAVEETIEKVDEKKL